MKRFLRETIVPWLAANLIRLMIFLLRIEVVDPEGILREQDKGPFLFAFWHNRLLLMGCFYRRLFPKRKVVAMISRSKDGEVIARVNDHFDLESARGSSSKKGNLAAREVIRKIQEGYDLALTPDGPRGPIHVVQPGIVQIAQLTGAAIVPVTYHLSRRKELRSWDRFQIPYPFARCRIVFSPRIHIPRDLAGDDLDGWCRRIGEAIGK